MGFGFKRNKNKFLSFTPSLFLLTGSFFILLLLFQGFRLLENIRSFSLDSASRPLQVVSMMLGGIDKNLGYLGFLVNKVLNKGIGSLNDYEFKSLLTNANNESLMKFLPEELLHLRPLIEGISGFDKDLYSLLGFESEQSYLVVLQNTSEKRPNGGFFGSFALVKFHKGTITHLEIIDSYLPGYDRPNTSITGPEWFDNFLPNRDIYFIGANKVGFTYHDGAHIKTLYEKSYPGQKIRGVVFLTTDMFKQLLPDFQKQLWERQFVNAAVDLIRGEDRWGKKEVYLESSQDFFQKHKEELILETIKELPNFLKEHRINFYLIDISGPFHGFLRRNNLTTRFEQETAYFWDSNISFNKIDQFVTKEVKCFDEDEKVVIKETNNDIISLLPLYTGERTCKITYKLYVDDEYRNYIKSLEDEYGITLGGREQHILGLTPSRDTRGVVHFPKNIKIFQITGDTYQSELFETPFSNALMYKSTISDNGGTASIFVRFKVMDEE